MDDLLHTVRAEFVSVWRFRWWATLAAWGVCGLGAFGVLLWPDQYAARAVVFIDVSSRLDEVIGGVAIEWDMQEQLERVRQQMLSTSVLQTVARETDLDLRATTPEQLSALVDSLRARITIEETRRRGADPRTSDSVLTISFSDASRPTALAVVQTLLDTFVRDVIRGGQGASEVARSFLMQRIGDYQQMLTAREQALADFKREHVGLLPSEAGDYFQRLQTTLQELEALQADLRTATNRQAALRAQLTSENPSLPPGTVSTAGTAPQAPGPLGTLQTRINELEATLDDYLLRFTEQHPDVIATRQQIDRLQEQRRLLVTELATAGGSEFEGSAFSTNPVYQSIQIALNGSKVEIAALESRIAEHQRRVAELRAKVDVIPEVEAQLAGLVRDYDQVKTIHDELVSRLEQERLGTAAVNDNVNFSVIEEPIAGFNPTSPNRMLLLVGLLVVGFGAGGGLAYLMSLLKPVFSTVKDLREFAELPVLGSVTVVESPAQRLTMKLQIAGVVSLALLLVAVFAVLISTSGEAARFLKAVIA